MTKLKVVAEPGKHTIVMTRELHAPRDLVFKVYTDPKLIPQWWGPSSVTIIVDKMEAKTGGVWRFIHRDADGSQITLFGVYHTLTPERIVSTMEFDGAEGHVGLDIVEFTEQDGKTLMKNTSVFQSVEDRDAMIASGMESGAAELWDRLEALLQAR
jgi:uncharacterized protein YndB with AHSA1/START domain